MSELTDLANDPRNYDELKDVFLCFIRLIGEESDGFYRYEFIFTDNIDEFWCENADQKPACLINDIKPLDEYVTEVHIVRTKIKLELIQDNCCFSVSDAMDGIVSLAWEDISAYDEYPQDGRIFFKFGESMEEVENKLAMKNILMK